MDALAQRLHAIGISLRQGRGTALFTLAAEVPAAILAKTLGIQEALALLEATLIEEKKADQKLTQLAETSVNESAARGAVASR